MSRALSGVLFLSVAVGNLFAASDRLEINKPSADAVELTVPGSVQQRFVLESSSDIEGAAWEPLSEFTLTNTFQLWNDRVGPVTQKFYRYRNNDAAPVAFASNFRLIDHRGKSRELYYYHEDTNVNAIVLVFTANGCADVEEKWPALEQLRQKYASAGVLFWMIDSKPGDTRASIAQEAQRLGITWPIMHDRAQSVGRAYGVTQTLEVRCVDKESFTLFYRGSLGEAGNVAYLDQAIGQFVNEEAVTLHQVAVAGCDVGIPPVATADYATEIAPMLQQKCVTCHSPGNVAPWAMTNHAVIKFYASLISEEVLAKNMPPWHADPEYGVFSNDRSLSLEQETKLLAWLDAGAPRGTGQDPLENVPPPPSKWPVQLGEPDMVIKCPPQTIRADGEEPYRYIYVQSGIPSNVWVRAAIVRPSNRAVVHHYLVWQGASSEQQASGIAGYTPGDDSGIFPPGTGIELPQDTMLTFNLHYTPTGEEEQDEPELGLWFYSTPPAKTLTTFPLVNQNFTIPPGATDHEVTFTFTLPVFAPPITVYSVRPHMHLRGSRMRFEIQRPNSATREIICSVPYYTFHWQTTYQLATPITIPGGTRIFVIGAFDNSVMNHENPDPTLPVTWGEQSWEEMFIGYIEGTL